MQNGVSRPPNVRPKNLAIGGRFVLAKYSFEFKMKVVEEYHAGKGSYKVLAKKHNIPAFSTVRQWVHAYNALGPDGLKRSRCNETYSFEFKRHVVELYLTSEVSYQELALSQRMKNPSLITRWVTEFRNGGLDALRPKQKGRKSTMAAKKKSTTPKETIPSDEYAAKLKELEDENLKLRIENAYLKELRRLRLAEEAKTKK